MLKPSFFRERARRSLAAAWKNSVFFCLISAITGGLGCLIPFFLCAAYYAANFLHSHIGFSEHPIFHYIYSFSEHLFPALSSIYLFALIYGGIIFLVGSCTRLGTYTYFCELMLGHHVSTATLFSQFSVFFKALLLRLFLLLKITLYSCLFLIPGIIAAYRYSMAPYILADNNNVGVLEAVKLSSQMMKRKKRKLFLLQLSFIPWFLLGILTCGIAFLWVIPYIQSAYAAFYIELSGQNRPFENYSDHNSPDFF